MYKKIQYYAKQSMVLFNRICTTTYVNIRLGSNLSKYEILLSRDMRDSDFCSHVRLKKPLNVYILYSACDEAKVMHGACFVPATLNEAVHNVLWKSGMCNLRHGFVKRKSEPEPISVLDLFHAFCELLGNFTVEMTTKTVTKFKIFSTFSVWDNSKYRGKWNACY